MSGKEHRGRYGQALAVLAGFALAAAGLYSFGDSDRRHPAFTDITSATGITFTHRASRTSRKYLLETMGSGVALFDFDKDGWLDVFFANGARLLDPMPLEAKPDKSRPEFYDRLYRNNRDGTFTDVTERAGVYGRGYSMGAAVADYDNDG